MNKVITISREFGSGGREIGRKLAEKLGVPFYDKEIINKIAEEMGLDESAVSGYEEHTIYPLLTGRSLAFYYMEPIQVRVIKEQFKFIQTVANKGPCVIVGRCANSLIKDSFDVMIYADINSRVKRCMERLDSSEDITEKEMKKNVIRVDKERSRYYYQNTGETWGDKHNYSLCINTTDIKIDDAVDVIIDLVNKE